MLEVELDKVHAFQRHKTTELARRIAQAEEDVHKLVKQEEAYHASLAALVRASEGQEQPPNGGTAGVHGHHQSHHLQGLGGHARMPTGRSRTFPSAVVDIERHAGQNGLHREDADGNGDVLENEEDEDDSDDDALGDESSSKSADTFEEQFRWLEEEVATLVADVHDLALYSKLNLTGFMKILKVCSTVPHVL